MSSTLAVWINSGVHYNDVIIGAIASQTTNLTIVYSPFYPGADQRKHQRSASLDFVTGIYRWQVNSPQEGPLTRKMFLFDDVIIFLQQGSPIHLKHGPLVVNMLVSLAAFLINWRFYMFYTIHIIGMRDKIRRQNRKNDNILFSFYAENMHINQHNVMSNLTSTNI